MKEYLERIKNCILEDGKENALKMIKSQNIQGPSASEFFGEEFGDKLKKIVSSSNEGKVKMKLYPVKGIDFENKEVDDGDYNLYFLKLYGEENFSMKQIFH